MKFILDLLIYSILGGFFCAIINWNIEKHGPWIGLSSGLAFIIILIIHRTKP